MQIAVLGMGRMGHAVAGRLRATGHDVVVWNRSPGKADDLKEKGAKEAPSAAEAAAGADAVVLSLADDAAVLSVVTGDGGVAGSLEGSVLVDMSTISPETAEKVRDAVAGRLLTSPILGAPTAVESGEAVYLVAGPKGDFERLSPLFQALGSQVRYLGEENARALELKLIGNYLLLAGIAVLAEAVALSEAVLPAEIAEDFLSSSPLVAPGLKNRLHALVSHDHSGWFTTALGAKDVGLAEDLARREGVRLPLAELVRRRYEEAASSGEGEGDITAILELVSPKTS